MALLSFRAKKETEKGLSKVKKKEKKEAISGEILPLKPPRGGKTEKRKYRAGQNN